MNKINYENIKKIEKLKIEFIFEVKGNNGITIFVKVKNNCNYIQVQEVENYKINFYKEKLKIEKKEINLVNLCEAMCNEAKIYEVKENEENELYETITKLYILQKITEQLNL